MSKPKSSSNSTGIDHTPRLAIAITTPAPTTSTSLYPLPSSVSDLKKQVAAISVKPTPVSSGPPLPTPTTLQHVATASNLLPRNNFNSAYNPYVYTYSRSNGGTQGTSKIQESPTTLDSKRPLNGVLHAQTTEQVANIFKTPQDSHQSESPAHFSSNQPSQQTTPQIMKNDMFTQNYRVSNTYRPISAQIVNPNGLTVAAAAAVGIAEKSSLTNNNIQQASHQQNTQQQQQSQAQLDLKRPPHQIKSKLNKSSKSETPFKLGEQQTQLTPIANVVSAAKPNSLGKHASVDHAVAATSSVKNEATSLPHSGTITDSPSGYFASMEALRTAGVMSNTTGQWRSQQHVQQNDSNGFRYGTAHSSHGVQQSQRLMSPKTEPSEFLAQNKLKQQQQQQLQQQSLQSQQQQQPTLSAAGISQSTLLIKQSQPHSNNLTELGHGRKSQTPKRDFSQSNSIGNFPIGLSGITSIKQQQQQVMDPQRVISPMRSKQSSVQQQEKKPPVQLTLLPIQPEQPRQVIIPQLPQQQQHTPATIPSVMKHKKSFSNLEINQASNQIVKDPQDMFLIRDQDTGQVYDIRQIDKIDTFSKTHNQEYFDKLKRRHKNAWQGWWNSKRENNLNLIEASQKNEFEIVQSLLQQRHERADIRADADFKDERQWSSLHYAVLNDSSAIVNLLLAHDADIDSLNDTDETPLIIAADKGFSEIVELLLKAGAEVNMQDNQMNTALHVACRNRHIKCVQLLLDHRHIDISLRNAQDKLANEMTESLEVKSMFMDNQRFSLEKKFSSENRSTVCLIPKQQLQNPAEFTSTLPQSIQGNASMIPKRSSFPSENSLSQSSYQSRAALKNPLQYGQQKKVQGSADLGGSWSTQAAFPNGNSGEQKGGNNNLSSAISPSSAVEQSPPQNNANKQSISSQGSFSSNTLSNGSNFYTSGLSGSGIHITSSQQQQHLGASGSSSSSASGQPWKVMIHEFPNESIMKLFSSANSTDFQGGDGFTSSLLDSVPLQQQTTSTFGPMKEANSVNQPGALKQHHKVQSLEVPTRNSTEGNGSYVNNGAAVPGVGMTKIGPDSFRIVNQIGRGSFGEVYLVEKKGTNTYFAMKMLHKSKVLGQNLTKYAKTERNVLSIMSHPFIVKLMYAFQTSKDLFLIMEFMPGGDLSHALQRDKKFSESRARIYLVEILLAIRHLHKNDIIYRDLKPENIVIDSEGHAMLTDFGLSKDGIYDHYSTHSFCGSLAYLAPEMLKRCGHGKAVDYYHLGVLLYEMLTGAPPFFSESKDDICHNIEFQDIRFPSHVSDNARNLISKLLVKNPTKRLGFGKNDFEEMKKHPFFSGINWNHAFQRKLKPPAPFIKPIVESKNKSTPNFMMTMTPAGMTTDNHISGWSFINKLDPDANRGEFNPSQQAYQFQDPQLQKQSSQPSSSSNTKNTQTMKY